MPKEHQKPDTNFRFSECIRYSVVHCIGCPVPPWLLELLGLKNLTADYLHHSNPIISNAAKLYNNYIILNRNFENMYLL
jgi:hypothetical protein